MSEENFPTGLAGDDETLGLPSDVCAHGEEVQRLRGGCGGWIGYYAEQFVRWVQSKFPDPMSTDGSEWDV